MVERVLTMPKREIWPADKHKFKGTPIYNAGVEADATKNAAALLSARLFKMFSAAALDRTSPGMPIAHLGGLRPELRLEQDVARPRALLIGIRPPSQRRRTSDRRGRGRAAAATAIHTSTGTCTAASTSSWTSIPIPTRGAEHPGRRQRGCGRACGWADLRLGAGPCRDRTAGPGRQVRCLAEPSSASARDDRLNEIKQREGCRADRAGLPRDGGRRQVLRHGFPEPVRVLFPHGHARTSWPPSHTRRRAARSPDRRPRVQTGQLPRPAAPPGEGDARHTGVLSERQRLNSSSSVHQQDVGPGQVRRRPRARRLRGGRRLVRARPAVTANCLGPAV